MASTVASRSRHRSEACCRAAFRSAFPAASWRAVATSSGSCAPSPPSSHGPDKMEASSAAQRMATATRLARRSCHAASAHPRSSWARCAASAFSCALTVRSTSLLSRREGAAASTERAGISATSVATWPSSAEARARTSSAFSSALRSLSADNSIIALCRLCCICCTNCNRAESPPVPKMTLMLLRNGGGSLLDEAAEASGKEFVVAASLAASSTRSLRLDSCSAASVLVASARALRVSFSSLWPRFKWERASSSR
eukprot:scaffold10723_cov113-Isochrysis_galbana.AAC.12